ncbi:MAG: type I restriction endonuclease subunit R, partial [Lachnospiraceae bacterium]|nr:type I restriction endonuclease subunit R [Candidatus Darwinimomas equi]
DIDTITNKNFAIIIDEAHQGQSGESAKTLRKSLVDIGFATMEYADEEGIDESEVDLTSDFINEVLGQGKHDNQSFFAFTATPKPESLEMFGTKEYLPGRTEPIYRPFHVYSMRQAIEEECILDVLSNYTTIKEAFKLIKVSKDNPELIEGPTSKALVKYYKKHGYTITQKTEMIMTNFLENGRYQIGGKGKAMVVADSRANAVRYYLAIKQYIKDHPDETVGTDVMIAFSGEVKLDEFQSEKPFTEATMNKDSKGKYITSDKVFRKVFHSDQYNILVVANKYQTGFDEPLLHSMYVDKKLSGINAVQTLSRLNRTTSGKTNIFVLDFENTSEEIKKAFLPYYETTILEGNTDVNTVYDLRAKIASFMLYSFDDVDRYVDFMKKTQTSTSLGKLTALLVPIINRYKELSEDEQYTLSEYIKRFNHAYAFITQLVRMHDEELFKEYQFTNNLIRLLPRSKTELIDVEDKIKLEYASLTESFKGAIILDEKAPIFVPKNDTEPRKPNKKQDTLQNIINKVNDRFNGEFTESDRVIIEGIYRMFMNDSDVRKFKKYAKDNSTEMFVKSLFPDKFKEIVTQCFLENNDSFQKLFNDPDFYQKVQDEMAKELYKSLRTE